jgi:hypothetical protein
MSFKQKLKEAVEAVGVAALYFGCRIAASPFLKTPILAELSHAP